MATSSDIQVPYFFQETVNRARTFQRQQSRIQRQLLMFERRTNVPLSATRLSTITAICATAFTASIDTMGRPAAVGVMSRGCRTVGLRDGAMLNGFFKVHGGDMAQAGHSIAVMSRFNYMDCSVIACNENAFKIHVRACPFIEAIREYGEGARTMLCTSCREFRQGIVDATGDDLLFTTEKTLGAGDPYCDFTITRIGESEPGAPLKKHSHTIHSFALFPRGRGYDVNGSFLINLLTTTLITMAAGSTMDPVFGLASRATTPVGLREGTRFMDYCDIHGDTVDAVANVLQLSFAILHMRNTVLDQTQSSVALNVTACALGMRIRRTLDEASIPDEKKDYFGHNVCEMCRAYHQGIIDAVSQEYELVIPSRISGGDSHCEFLVVRQFIQDVADK